MTVTGPAGISVREAEVLALVGLHLTNAQIATRLHLSVRTVESHVSAMLRKLDAADRRELADLAPGLASAPVAGAGLSGPPLPWTTFVGRQHETSVVLAALNEARLVNLTGPCGVGKTRLATAVAAQGGEAFPFGGAFVELVGVRPEFVVQAVATALGVSEQPQRPLEEVIYAHLAQRKALLVLDNCEHVLAVAAEFVSGLLEACRAVIVLSTSRERLGVPGERVIIVPALSLAADLTAGTTGSEAELLFLDRARSADPGFSEDPSLVRDLCARVDGMPLAIELAAARAGSLGIAGLLAGIDDQLRLLSGGRTADERHRSLRSVLDWSYGLLDDDEQRVLCRLGVFAGGFDLAAVAAVAAEPDDAGAAADLLGRLVDKSLVMHRRTAGRSRWYLLETVRAYALDRLAAGHGGTDSPIRCARASRSQQARMRLDVGRNLRSKSRRESTVPTMESSRIDWSPRERSPRTPSAATTSWKGSIRLTSSGPRRRRWARRESTCRSRARRKSFSTSALGKPVCRTRIGIYLTTCGRGVDVEVVPSDDLAHGERDGARHESRGVPDPGGRRLRAAGHALAERPPAVRRAAAANGH